MQALDTLRVIEDAGLEPTVASYGCAIAACEGLGNVDAAFDVWRQFLRSGCPLHDDPHLRLVALCADHGRLDEMLRDMRRLLSLLPDRQAHLLNTMARALAQAHFGVPSFFPLPLCPQLLHAAAAQAQSDLVNGPSLPFFPLQMCADARPPTT